MTSIKCLVEECKYNDSSYCAAQQIEVRSNGASKVCKPEQTACETFATQG